MPITNLQRLQEKARNIRDPEEGTILGRAGKKFEALKTGAEDIYRGTKEYVQGEGISGITEDISEFGAEIGELAKKSVREDIEKKKEFEEKYGAKTAGALIAWKELWGGAKGVAELGLDIGSGIGELAVKGLKQGADIALGEESKISKGLQWLDDEMDTGQEVYRGWLERGPGEHIGGFAGQMVGAGKIVRGFERGMAKTEALRKARAVSPELEATIKQAIAKGAPLRTTVGREITAGVAEGLVSGTAGSLAANDVSAENFLKRVMGETFLGLGGDAITLGGRYVLGKAPLKEVSNYLKEKGLKSTAIRAIKSKLAGEKKSFYQKLSEASAKPAGQQIREFKTEIDVELKNTQAKLDKISKTPEQDIKMVENDLKKNPNRAGADMSRKWVNDLKELNNRVIELKRQKIDLDKVEIPPIGTEKIPSIGAKEVVKPEIEPKREKVISEELYYDKKTGKAISSYDYNIINEGLENNNLSINSAIKLLDDENMRVMENELSGIFGKYGEDVIVNIRKDKVKSERGEGWTTGGQYSWDDSLISLFEKGKTFKTFTHEFSHHLENFLTKKDVVNLQKLYDVELNKKAKEYNTTTDQIIKNAGKNGISYRYRNVDEFFAVTMQERFSKRAGTIKLFGEHGKWIDDIFNYIKALFSARERVVGRIQDKFKKLEYRKEKTGEYSGVYDLSQLEEYTGASAKPAGQQIREFKTEIDVELKNTQAKLDKISKTPEQDIKMVENDLKKNPNRAGADMSRKWVNDLKELNNRVIELKRQKIDLDKVEIPPIGTEKIPSIGAKEVVKKEVVKPKIEPKKEIVEDTELKKELRKFEILREEYDIKRVKGLGFKFEHLLRGPRGGLGSVDVENKVVQILKGKKPSGITTHEIRHIISELIGLKFLIDPKKNQTDWMGFGTMWGDLKKYIFKERKDIRGRTGGIENKAEIEEAVVDFILANDLDFKNKFPVLVKKAEKAGIRQFTKLNIPFKDTGIGKTASKQLQKYQEEIDIESFGEKISDQIIKQIKGPKPKKLKKDKVIKVDRKESIKIQKKTADSTEEVLDTQVDVPKGKQSKKVSKKVKIPKKAKPEKITTEFKQIEKDQENVFIRAKAEEVRISQGKPPKRPKKSDRAGEKAFEYDIEVNMTKWAKTRAYAQDDMHPINRMQKNLKKQKFNITEETDIYLGEEVFHGKVSTETSTKLNEITDDIIDLSVKNDISFEQINMYAQAKHASEANIHAKKISPEMTKGSGMGDVEATKILDEFEKQGKTVELEEARKYIWGKYNDLLDYQVEHGLLKLEDATALKKQFEFYVSLKRKIDDKGAPVAIGKKFQVRGKEYQRRKGSEELEVRNVIGNLLENWHTAIVRANKNAVGNKLLNLVEQAPDPKFWSVKKQQYKPVYDAYGEIKYMEKKKLPDNVFLTKRDGFQYVIEINKSEQGQAVLKSMIGIGANNTIPYLNGFTRWQSKMATAWDMAFMIPNLARDVQLGFIKISTDYSVKMAKDVMLDIVTGKSTKALIGKGEFADLAKEFKAEGGTTGVYGFADHTKLMKELDRKLDYKIGSREYLPPEGEKFWKTMTKKYGKEIVRQFEGKTRAFFNGLETVNDLIENQVRFGLYKQLRIAGYSKAKSASAAKNVTVNFNKKGSGGAVKFITSAWMFANAGLQGIVSVLKLLKTKRGRIALGTLAGAYWALDMYNRQFEGYDLLSESEKERYMHIFNPITSKQLSIPAGYGINVPKVVMQEVNSMAFDGRTLASGSFNVMTSLLNSFNPINGSALNNAATYFPSAVSPIFATWTNKAWHGGSVYPEDRFGKEPRQSQQFYGSSREKSIEWARDASRWTGGKGLEAGWAEIHPDSIDYLIDAYGSGVGRTLANIYDTGQALIDPDLDVEISNIPILRRFITEPESEKNLKRVFFDLRDKENKRTKKENKLFLEVAEKLVEKGVYDQEYMDETLGDVTKKQLLVEKSIVVSDYLEDMDKDEYIDTLKTMILTKEINKPMIKALMLDRGYEYKSADFNKNEILDAEDIGEFTERETPGLLSKDIDIEVKEEKLMKEEKREQDIDVKKIQSQAKTFVEQVKANPDKEEEYLRYLEELKNRKDPKSKVIFESIKKEWQK